MVAAAPRRRYSFLTPGGRPPALLLPVAGGWTGGLPPRPSPPPSPRARALAKENRRLRAAAQVLARRIAAAERALAARGVDASAVPSAERTARGPAPRA